MRSLALGGRVAVVGLRRGRVGRGVAARFARFARLTRFAVLARLALAARAAIATATTITAVAPVRMRCNAAL